MLAELNENEITNPLRVSTDSQNGLRHRKSGDKRTVSVESTYGPDPPDGVTRKSVLRNIAGFILVTEFCERVAYYGFAGSLVLFFQTQLNLTNAEADVQFSAWSGICYITPLIGGYIADTYLGRYHTILVFCIIYLAGLLLVVIECVPGDTKAPLFYLAIYIIALGTGGIKPNVSTLGADQFDERYARDRRELMSFFNWFYWMVNLGALIAYSLIAYLCQYGLPSAGGEAWGFFLGYTIPCCTMFAGICIFVAGTPLYKRKAPSGSVLSTAVNIVYEAVVTRYSAPRPPPRTEEEEEDAGQRSLRADEEADEDAKNHQNNSSNTIFNNNNNTKPPVGHIIDKASVRYGGSFPDHKVQGVKLVTRLLPFLGVLIPFWGIYSQMSTAFQNQACQMDLDLGAGVQMPVSALNSFDTIAILCLVPLFDAYLYPQLALWMQRPIGMLEKIGAGFFVAILAMLVAACVEIARIQYAPPETFYTSLDQDTSRLTPCQQLRDYDPFSFQRYLAQTDDDTSGGAPLYCHQTCAVYVHDNATNTEVLSLTCIACDALPLMSSLSVFWQVPQFCLIGIAEILASITSLEFFYSQAPTAMRSVSQSLNLATTAAGSFLVIPLLLLVNSNPNDPWVPANLDEGHLANYFFVLAALMAATLLLFVRLSATYTYKTSAELALLDDDHQLPPGTSTATTTRKEVEEEVQGNPLHSSSSSVGLSRNHSRNHSHNSLAQEDEEVGDGVDEGESKEDNLSPNSSHGLL